MHALYQKAFETLRKLLIVHVSNKGTDPTHHEFTNIYNDILVIAHDIGEKLSDIGEPLETSTNEEFRQSVYDSIEELKTEIEDFVSTDKPTIGADNMLRGIVDDLEGLCNKANSFIVECEQEEETPETEKKEIKPLKIPGKY